MMADDNVSPAMEKAIQYHRDTDSEITLDDIVGQDQAVQEFKRLTEYARYSNVMESMHIFPAQGLLLIGEPGTGKSITAEAFANDADLDFYTINNTDFTSMYVGKAERRLDMILRGIEEFSEKYDRMSAVFFDEFDDWGQTRNSSIGHNVHGRVLNVLLRHMDSMESKDANVVYIAATNMPDTLDSAVMRAGRFDYHIYFSEQSKEDVAELFATLVDVQKRKRKKRMRADQHIDEDEEDLLSYDVDYEKIADAAYNIMKQGADVEEIIRRVEFQKGLDMIDNAKSDDGKIMDTSVFEVTTQDFLEVIANYEDTRYFDQKDEVGYL